MESGVGNLGFLGGNVFFLSPEEVLVLCSGVKKVFEHILWFKLVQVLLADMGSGARIASHFVTFGSSCETC